jgi:hypothetical protein
MHEDLNSISIKPFIETQESNGRPDNVVADEYWTTFTKRNESIFTKHFYG